MTYKGLVIKSLGSSYSIRSDNGVFYECKLRGKFRTKGIKTTNPIAVGDRVVFVKEENSPYGVIMEILPRKNYICRKSINLSKISHIIAANIDVAFLIISLKDPKTPLGFIDRFLITAQSFRIPTVIVFNKTDIYDTQNILQMTDLQSIYQPLGYHCIATSAVTKSGMNELKSFMQDKITLFSGQSGVGKSSIINTIETHLQLKTATISHYNSKGKHTTTFAELFELSFGGYIIDTPGIKEFGLIDYTPQEIGHYLPEMLALLPHCKFNNCTHTHEPQCAVKQALNEGKIAPSRYNNYLSIINDDDIELKEWI
ncbi:MAG: ribosome small subunit-dependent GTPase A [Bacteroidales bacterium]|jgi:ribosome biogenesis GTPase|nr:ribosome small subunit-dependent GTPase A [Bacteroidales bacterium]